MQLASFVTIDFNFISAENVNNILNFDCNKTSATYCIIVIIKY